MSKNLENALLFITFRHGINKEICLSNRAGVVDSRVLHQFRLVQISGRAWPATLPKRIGLGPAPGSRLLDRAAAEMGPGGCPDFLMRVAVAVLFPRQTGICHINIFIHVYMVYISMEETHTLIYVYIYVCIYLYAGAPRKVFLQN